MASPARPPAPAATRDEELDEGRMPFLEHLQELRLRLRNASLVFMVAVVACWFWSKEIYAWLRVPLEDAWAANPKLGPHAVMQFRSVVEPFWVYVSVALWAGVFVSSPAIFYQLWKFIAPGLYKRERRIGIVFALVSAVFFVGGAAFCYYLVLARMFTYLLAYADPSTQPALMLSEYFELTRNLMLAFGAVFELPLLIYFLAAVGLVTHRGLWKFNRWFIVLAFIIGAILTPSPDVVSQVMMALPMIALYNLSILVAYFVTRRRERAAAQFA